MTTKLIADEIVDAGFAGLPVAYSSVQTKKVIIMMGDGANTYEFRMGDAYSSGLSDLYAVNYTEEMFDYAYKKNKVWKTSTDEGKCSKSKWVCVYTSEDFTDYYLERTSDGQFFDIEGDNWISGSSFLNLPTFQAGWTSTVQKPWGEAWGQMASQWYDGETGNNAFDDLVYGTGRTGTEADTAMASTCAAVATSGIVVYTIGFETNSTTSDKLRDCASSPSHDYDASGTQITSVFSAIAPSIQRLKLTQ